MEWDNGKLWKRTTGILFSKPLGIIFNEMKNISKDACYKRIENPWNEGLNNNIIIM